MIQKSKQEEKKEEPKAEPISSPNGDSVSGPSGDDSERRIFKYWDGFKWIYGDPFEIDYALEKAKETENMSAVDQWINAVPRDDEGNILPSVTFEEMKLFNEAMHRYVPIILKGFGVKPYDRETGEGLTGVQLIKLYSDYLGWRFNLKKNTGE